MWYGVKRRKVRYAQVEVLDRVSNWSGCNSARNDCERAAEYSRGVAARGWDVLKLGTSP